MAETKEANPVDAAAAKAPAEEPNLWSTLLRESSKKTQNPDATVIVCGNAQSGKRNLIAKLASTSVKDKDLEINDIVSFTFFELDEGYSEHISRVNVWTFGESTHLFEKACDIIAHRSTANGRFVFVVVLDLAKPEECMMSLVQWLAKISIYIKKYYGNLSPETAQALKHSLIKYLQDVRLTKGEASKEDKPAAEGEEKVEDLGEKTPEEIMTLSKEVMETICEHIGLPVIVVACKSDTILPDDGPSVRRARDLQVQLRSICLDVGAALCFTSASEDVNCTLLRNYLVHRLCPEGVPMELAIEDKVELTFYPSGFDTEEMIMIAAGAKGLFGTDSIFKAKLKHLLEHPEDLHKNEDAEDAVAGNVPSGEVASANGNGLGVTGADGLDLPLIEMEPEQEWLSKLHEFIVKVSASGGPAMAKVEETNLVAAPNSPMDPTRDGKILGPRKPAVRPTPASGEKKNVGDFFKNLLESGPTKK